MRRAAVLVVISATVGCSVGYLLGHRAAHASPDRPVAGTPVYDEAPGKAVPRRTSSSATPARHRTPHAATTGTSRRSLGVLRTTAYCWTSHRTASGKWPALGMVATLDRSIPFGTVLSVGGRRYVVEDRIGSGSSIDLYYGRGPDCVANARDFGVRYLRVEVVK